jgi:hypothetical protein
MGIFEKIRQAFSSADADLSDEARAFIESIATSQIWILAVGLRGTPAIPRIFDDSAMMAITDHRIDVSEMGDDDSVFPFNYGEGEKQVLPFFTTEARAKDFATSKGASVAQVFQPCPMLAGFVTSPENDDFDLILDPGTSERRITSEERRLLRRLSVASQRGAG